MSIITNIQHIRAEVVLTLNVKKIGKRTFQVGTIENEKARSIFWIVVRMIFFLFHKVALPISLKGHFLSVDIISWAIVKYLDIFDPDCAITHLLLQPLSDPRMQIWALAVTRSI